MTDVTEVTNDLKPQVTLSKLGFDEERDYVLDQNLDWIGEYVKELEAELDHEDPAYVSPDLRFDLTLKRKSAKPYGDHLLLKGHLSGRYQAACVRCLAPTEQNLDIDVKVGFINERFERDPDYDEVTDIYVDGDEYELFFYYKGIADISEALHEFVFMNVEPLPLHDENCLGLCPVCGVDLNTERCEHTQKEQ